MKLSARLIPAWLIAADLMLPGLMLPNCVKAEEIQDDRIKFVETETAECDINAGKLVTLQNVDPVKTMVVLVDRWFNGVQTEERVKQILKPQQTPTPLGCSMTGEGDQHWTLYSVEPQL